MLGVKRCYWGFWNCPFYHLLIQFCGIFYWIFPSVGVGCLFCRCHTVLDFFSAVNIVTVCNSSHSARGLAASVEISKYICIYSYVFFIDISIITVIHVIHVCLQTPLDVYQNMYPFPSSSVSTIKCFTYYGLESSNNYTRFIRY